MDLVLEKKELSKRVTIVKNHKLNIERMLSPEEERRVNEIVNKYKCPNVIRAKKALDSCEHYNQKFVAARYGILAVDHDFEKFRPSKRKEIFDWECDKRQAKVQFLLFIEEGGFEV